MPFFKRNKDKVSKNDSSLTLEDFTTNANTSEVTNTDKPVLSRIEKHKRGLPIRGKKEDNQQTAITDELSDVNDLNETIIDSVPEEIIEETNSSEEKENSVKVRVHFSEHYDDKGQTVPVANVVYYNEKESVPSQSLNQIVAETRASITPSMKLAKLLIKKYVEDKLYPNHSQITTGSIIAGIKFIDTQVKELFGEGLTRDDHQILLSSAITEASVKGVGVKPINIQTKGKVYKTRAIIKNLKRFSREDLIELLGE